MYKLVPSKKFAKDLKKCIKMGLDENRIKAVLEILKNTGQLPTKYNPHKLVGQYKGLWECHIEPNWLLIYEKEKKIKLIRLARTGRHSDLFDE